MRSEPYDRGSGNDKFKGASNHVQTGVEEEPADQRGERGSTREGGFVDCFESTIMCRIRSVLMLSVTQLLGCSAASVAQIQQSCSYRTSIWRL